MKSKLCANCKKLFYKTPNLSQKYWEEKRLYCSNRCKVLGKPSPKKGKIYQHLWKTNVKYGTLHLQTYKKYGKANKCIHCGSKENVEWANKSNKYKSVDDFIELCGSCHTKYDYKMNHRIPWNKGKKGIYTKETLIKMGIKNKGKIPHNKKERKTIYCKCGCGKTRINVDSRGRNRFYIHGHNKIKTYGRPNI